MKNGLGRCCGWFAREIKLNVRNLGKMSRSMFFCPEDRFLFTFVTSIRVNSVVSQCLFSKLQDRNLKHRRLLHASVVSVCFS